MVVILWSFDIRGFHELPLEAVSPIVSWSSPDDDDVVVVMLLALVPPINNSTKEGSINVITLLPGSMLDGRISNMATAAATASTTFECRKIPNIRAAGCRGLDPRGDRSRGLGAGLLLGVDFMGDPDDGDDNNGDDENIILLL